MVAYRFLLAAVVLSPWALTRPGIRRHLKESFWLSALLAALYISQTVGLQWTSASNSGFITGLFILFVPIFLWAFAGDRPAGYQSAAVALALAGLWLLTGGPTGFNRGDAWTLVAAATYAGHLLVIDRTVKKGADTVVLAFHQFWMTGLLTLTAAAAWTRPWSVGSPRAAATIVFLALVPTLSAFFVQMIAQKRAQPLRVALIFSLEPVFAALFAWTLGGELFRPSGALGGLLIVAAMVVSELSKLTVPSARRKEILPV
jgi:drug/metabolite transporter (DMT)-like permease